MHYDTTFGHSLYQEVINKSQAYKELHNYIYSKEFVKTFLNIFNNEIENEIDNNFLTDDKRHFVSDQISFEESVEMCSKI